MSEIGKLNIWKKEERDLDSLEGLRAVDISEMNLSVRSFNCLKRANCNKVGDILDIMEEDENGLRKIRNLGTRSEKEIKEMLEKLKKEYAYHPAPADKPRQRLAKPSYKALDRPISDFRISSRSRNQLKTAGVCYVRDLYSENLQQEPGWYAVRELFEVILQE